MSKTTSGTGGTGARPHHGPAKAAAVNGKKNSRSQINLRLTKAEKAALRIQASRTGLSLTAYLLAAGLHHADPADGAYGAPDFTKDGPEATGRKSSSHSANLQHLLNWTQVLEQRQVGTSALRETLKRHLEQAKSNLLWQEEARRLGRQLVQATNLGTHTPVLQAMMDALARHLRQHQERT